MTAVDILKQSFNFYGRLFNKVFWLSIASALSPLLMFFSMGDGQPSLVGTFLVMAVSMFFSAYMMVLVHQFSQDQNDSLGDAFRLTLKKVLPISGTSIIFGLGAMVIAIPAAIIGSLLASGIDNEQLQAGFVALVVAVPISFYLYRCFFAVYFTLLEGTTPFDALKASNTLIKKNVFIFRSFMLLSLIMLAYIVVVILISLMVAVGPMAQAILEFAVNVIVLPYFTIFIYRLFVVSKDQFEQQASDTDFDADD
ncbi:MAG: hypothetical protein ACI8SR_000673 [Oceanicoccus sp.]|jgi:hypothetical protein